MRFPALPFTRRLSPRQKRVALWLASLLGACILGLACALAPVLVFLRFSEAYTWASAMTLQSISMDSADDGWAVGASGGIYRYDSGEWAKVASPVARPLYGLSSGSHGNAWAVGLGGALLRYHDGAWQQETNVVWSKAAKDAWK